MMVTTIRKGKMLTVQEFRQLFGTERRCGAQLTGNVGRRASDARAVLDPVAAA
jgi:hypothetical protein